MPKKVEKITCSNYGFFTVISSDNDAKYFLTNCKDYQLNLVRLESVKLLLDAKIINFDTLLSFDKKQSEVFHEAALRSETYLIELLAINPLFQDVTTINRTLVLSSIGSAYSNNNLQEVADFLEKTPRPMIDTLHKKLGRAALATGVITLNHVQLVSQTEQAQEFISLINRNDALEFLNKLQTWFHDLKDTVAVMLKALNIFISLENKDTRLNVNGDIKENNNAEVTEDGIEVKEDNVNVEDNDSPTIHSII